MSRGPESLTKDAVERLLQAYKDVGLPMWWAMPIPALGTAGLPDFIACIDGTFLSIECKAEKRDGGREPTQRQIKVMHALTLAGGVTFIVGEASEFELLRRWLGVMLGHWGRRDHHSPTPAAPVPWRSEAVKTRRKPPPLRGPA